MAQKDLLSTYLNAYDLMHRYSMTWYRKYFNGMDPWQGQGRILSALRTQYRKSQRELGLTLDIRPQSLGELLQKLEDNEYIRRYRSPTDKRALVVELTNKGELFQIKQPDYEALFVDLTPSERKEFKEMLEKVSARLIEQIKKEEEEDFYY